MIKWNLQSHKIRLIKFRRIGYEFILFNIHTVLGYLYGLFFIIFSIFYDVT